MAEITGLDGLKRQAVAEALWAAWRNDGCRAAILVGFSGTGKTDKVVRPLADRAVAAKLLVVHIDVPAHSVDLDRELMALLAENLEAGLAAEVMGQPNFNGALRLVLGRGGLVVLDEFQRRLDAQGKPDDNLGGLLAKIATRQADGGCLWLVSNREIDLTWSEPFQTKYLPEPEDLADRQKIVQDNMGSVDQSRFPVERRQDVTTRLGGNPRALRLLGNLLRTATLDDLLGPADGTPPDPRLWQEVERQLVAKAKDRLSNQAAMLLGSLSVLCDPALWDLVNAMGADLGDPRPASRELQERYLLEIHANRYRLHPIVAEVESRRLRRDEAAWQAANRLAGTWYARALHGTDEVRIARHLPRARFHLAEAHADAVLRDALVPLRDYLGHSYHQNSPLPADAAERDGQIALLQAVLDPSGLGEQRLPDLEYRLARLLKERNGPGDCAAALLHARRGAEGCDQATPWALWLKLVAKVNGPAAAIAAAEEALKAVAPDKGTFSIYLLLALNHQRLGQVPEAVADCLAGAEICKGNGYRLVQEALQVAASEPSEKLLATILEWLSGRDAFAQQLALGQVLLLECRGQWRQAAEAARAAHQNASTYFVLVQHEALAWLGVGDAARADAALQRFPRPIRRTPQTAHTWLAAMVAVQRGHAPAAAELLATFLDVAAMPDGTDIADRLLREWKGYQSGDRPPPASAFPILPASITGLGRDVRWSHFGDLTLPQHAPSSPPATTPSGALRILAVATEWSSGHGGLSTFNRELCKALAKAGTQVVCQVLKASDQERQNAAPVTLVEAPLGRKPALPQGFTPDIIIGHGRITGPTAQALAEDHFPEAKRWHFLHMAPDEIEWLKSEREDDPGARAEERTITELDLGSTAARAIAVGPRLHSRFLRDMSAYTCPAPLRFDPGFETTDPTPRLVPPGKPWMVLMLGRLEDAELKGLDIAAKAVGIAARERGHGQTPLELVVRGAPPATSGKLKTQLDKWLATPQVSAVPRPYTVDSDRLQDDLKRASLVLMPSRTEGFGLVGLEAIVAGVPVLVSSESGLGELLTELLPADMAARFVVPLTDKPEQKWGQAIKEALSRREAAFAEAAELRALLSATKTWETAVAALLRDTGA